MNSIALIPARGGSKGFPRKNLANFLGEPLIIQSIRYALNSNCFDRVIVSTDDTEIASIAQSAGAEVPGIRPSELASDTTPMVEVIKYCIKEYQLQKYQSLVLLDPTSPVRNSVKLRDVIEVVESSETIDGIISISKAFYNPLWLGVNKHQNNLIKPLFVSESSISGRQEFQDYWRINGVLYCWKMEKATTLTSSYLNDLSISFIETPEIESIAIDYAIQLQLLECLITGGLIKI